MSRARSRSIVGPVYDTVFFLLPPLVGLALGVALARSGASDAHARIFGEDRRVVGFGIGVLIHTHLVAVFLRSHVDASVFRLHKLRFVLVPLVLFAALASSPWLAALSIVVATFWDVLHSGAQTFGLARIYDRNAGVSVDSGRGLELVLNHLAYAGPVLAGATLASHVGAFHEFDSLDDPIAQVLSTVPARAEGLRAGLAWVLLAVGGLVATAYVRDHVRRARRGEPTSPAKAWLVASTTLCSIVSWGFNPWGEAFFVMNFFHAVQYLGLVFATEREVLTARLHLPSNALGVTIATAVFGALCVAYGIFAESVDADIHLAWAATMVVSLMHFWYDGFVWSVRARMI